MNHLRSGIVIGSLLLVILLVVSPAGVLAHVQEDFVDWEIGFGEIRYTSVPVVTEMKNGVQHMAVAVVDQQPTLQILTGDMLRVDWNFTFVSEIRHRGDLFWITRLGLDFATIGRYVNDEWIGGHSFALDPGEQYNATLVIRAIKPVEVRHLHVGVSINDVGNIPAAPSPDPAIPVREIPPIPVGGPVLYGVFYEATGPIVEPLEGLDVPIDGNPFPGDTFPLLATWPWALAGFVAQIFLGLGFIAVMFWYGRMLKKRAGGG